MKRSTKWFLISASVVAMLVARCGGVLVPSPADVQDASTDSVNENDLAFGDATASDDVVEDVSFLPAPDAGAYPPPLKACDIDGGSKPCPNPPSICANSDWLVYYEKGRCVDGGCTWETRWTECRVHDCIQGHCQSFATPN